MDDQWKDLTPSQQGKINGAFELHFGAKLNKGSNITVERNREWCCDKAPLLYLEAELENRMRELLRTHIPPSSKLQP
jgi:hypothetical protein